MQVVITEYAGEVADLSADAIEAALRRRPDAVLGVATGSSPVGTYDELGRRVAARTISLARASAFMLDEYVGLPAGHRESYRSVIQRIFAAKVDIDPDRIHGPEGTSADIPSACADYEQAIVDAGGIDLQLLGIGSDGHIAFNEPSSSLASRTRIKTLTHQTRLDNSRFFGGDLDAVPTHCLTQGIATILDARRIVLVATGRSKAEAINHTVEGALSAMWPGSALQLHPDVTVIVDTAAGSRLQLADYYREVWNNKPSWQGW
ncbi:MAG: glucosamine-6-phosphate deaminase [Terracoccus sp.]